MPYVLSMDSPLEEVSAHYLYRSVAASRQGPGTLYLVSRLEGSNVVARIDVVAAKRVPSTKGASAHPSNSQETALRVVSPWSETTSRHHAKARVEMAS
jgi:hypothetical protein